MVDEILMRLPFAYAAEAVLPPRRKPERLILKAFVDIMVPSVPADEAPEAIRLVRHDIPARYPSFKGPTPVEVYRTFEGRLYTALGSGKAIPVDDFQRDVSTPDAWGRGGRFAYSPDHAARNGAPVWHRESYPLKIQERSCANVLTALTWEDVKASDPKARVVSHKRDEAMAAAAVALRERLLVVDGTVWTSQPTREPHWLVHVDFNASKVAVSFSLTPDPSSYLSPFRLDRLDDAVDYAKHVARELGWAYSGTEIDAVVSIPEALRYDDGVGLAQTLVKAMGWGHSGRLPDGAEGRILRGIRDEASGAAPIDTAWAGRVFAGFATLADMGCLDSAFEPDTRTRRLGQLAFARWTEREYHRRTDILSLGQPDLDEEDVKSLGL